MQYLDYIKANNPVIFNIFKNAYDQRRLSHAYLFAGNKTTKIDQEPLGLAQLLISDDPFHSLGRDIHKYLDFEIITNASVIKKEVITRALNRLQETAFEKDGKKILLIKNLERANLQSLNALLKFLEAPTPNTYLLFTTNNLAQILRTIQSRTQIIHVKSPSQKQVIADFMTAGIDAQNARLLADFTTDVTQATLWHKELLDAYKTNLLVTLEQGFTNSELVYTNLHTLLLPTTTTLVLNLLNTFLNDLWRFKNGIVTAFTTTKLFDRYNDVNFDYRQGLIAINDFFEHQKLNVNFDLAKSKFLLTFKGLYG